MTKRRTRPTVEQHDWPSEFRPVEGWNGYVVCKDGTLWSNKFLGKWREHGSQKPTRYGYRVATLRDFGRKRHVFVHVLVMEAFVGPCPDGMETRHLNGIRDDNRLENLAWGTSKENAGDKKRHGTLLFGETSPMTKLSNSDVKEIRELRAQGHSFKGLAEKYGVSYHTIVNIDRGRGWKHLESVSHDDMRFKYDDETIREVRRRHERGETGYRISKDLGVAGRYVYDVINGKRRRNVV